ncbi:hypothetical protein LUZ60_014081 [Juncus effusus]|nr:hypothetical protein LUZ60_014081 [Juncus effusus]
MEEVEVIHAWSTPRSLSTSLMYSFAQIEDMEIVDEPFYANFLRVTGIERPYRDELLSKTEPDVNKLLNKVILGPGKKKYRYCKMSFQKVSQISFQELGFPALLAIYSELFDLGCPPPVINAEDLQNDPQVSAFDSVVQEGDAVREVLCLHDGKIFKLEEHLDRLLDFAKDLAFNNIPSKETIKDAIFETLILNRMFDKAQISLTLTRGRKAMDLLAKEKLVVLEGKMKLSELQFADEVVRINGSVIGSGEAGPITKKIQNGYKNLIAECGAPIPMNQEAQ